MNRTTKTNYSVSGRRQSKVAFSLALLSVLASMQSQAQVALPASAKVTADKTKPGFLWRVFQNNADQVNSTAKTEAALGGTLSKDGSLLPNQADPSAQGPAAGPGTKLGTADNALIEFVIPEVINFSQAEGEGNGNFTPDLQMPGVPGTEGGADGIAAEIITYLDLPAGVITMGVNSDDGFRTQAGTLGDAFRAVNLGEFSGGRGASDTTFTFAVTEAGVYPFRTTWEEGGGGANVEWFTVKADGTKVLVNDAANGGVKAYRAANVGPKPPTVVSVVPGPAPRQLNGVSPNVVVVLADGDTTTITDSSISFKVDGIAVTDIKRSGKQVTLTYTPTGIQFPDESHTAELSFAGSGGFTRTEKWTFKNLKNVILPATAVATENFDSTAEGTQPAGWVATNFTPECNPGEDPTDQKSDTYRNWVTVTTENMPSIDDAGITEVNATETINGKPLTLELLRSGKVLYAESDSRCNGTARAEVLANKDGQFGQTQFIVSKAFNLTTAKNPVLAFSSGYMQNQDSYGGVEYSVDGGKSWLPVVYFLDGPVIKTAADGSIDGVETLNTVRGDTSLWVVNGEVKGERYGDAVAAPINASIGNYIVERVNDNGAEGKRTEIFRLPAAANKPDVRLRLSATGSDSWYFFVDNIAFYDIAPAGGTTTPSTGLAGKDIGAGTGSTTVVGDGAYKIVGGGLTARNAAGDDIHFAGESVTGDFDKKVKIKSISAVASDNNRGGIMVRETADPTSPSLEIVATGLSSEVDDNGNPRGGNNVVFYTRPDASTGYTQIGRGLGGLDKVLPNQWLRLRRVGNYFSAYVSKDGQSWSMVAERFANNFASTAMVGLYAASASADGSVKATVEFESYGSVVSTEKVAPTLVSAGTLDKKVIGVKFSESVNSSSVSKEKFTVSGATVTAASVGIGGDSVYLTVNGLTADSFTVTATGVTDSNGNAIAAGAQVSGKATTGWTAVDMGRFAADPSKPRAATDDPVLPGQSVAVSSGDRAELEIVAGGSNIWNPGDFQHYVYTDKTGDFDVQVEVVRFDRSANTGSFGHAGIQVRESLYTEPSAQFTANGTKVRDIMNTTYAEGNVDRTGILLWRDEVGAGYGNGAVIGANTPDSRGVIGRWGRLRAGDASGAPIENTSETASRWLRVKRSGNDFSAYWSYDGVEWTENPGSPHTLALPAKVVVGFAEMADTAGVTSNGADDSTDNKPWYYNVLHIRNFGDVTLAVAPKLSASISAGQLVVTWTGSGTLESASSVKGPWTAVAGATSGVKIAPSAAAAFYRVRR